MSKKMAAVSTLLFAIGTLGLQLGAIVFLSPEEYGYFSAPYLLSAFFLSVQLSTVSEAWIRTARLNGIESTWQEYSSVSLYLSVLSAAAGAVLCAAFSSLQSLWWLVALACAGTTYRASARFYSLKKLDWPGVLWGDAVGTTLTVLTLSVFFVIGDVTLMKVIVAWAVISVASAIVSRFPALLAPPSIATWIRNHRKSIGPLLRDSLIMDASSIGTPYALVPVLGISDFGIYRAVSNVAAPVRLLLNPLRPRFSTIAPQKLTSMRFTVLLAGGGILMGAGAGIALYLLRYLGIEAGTLTSLTAFIMPVSLFVAANFFGHANYLFARQLGTARNMLVARLIQTFSSILVPITAGVLYGINGAIWGYALATLLSSIAWLYASRSALANGD